MANPPAQIPKFVNLNEFTLGLIDDLKELRMGEITNADGRVRAQLAREVLRSCHIMLETSKQGRLTVYSDP